MLSALHARGKGNEEELSSADGGMPQRGTWTLTYPKLNIHKLILFFTYFSNDDTKF